MKIEVTLNPDGLEFPNGDVIDHEKLCKAMRVYLKRIYPKHRISVAVARYPSKDEFLRDGEYDEDIEIYVSEFDWADESIYEEAA
jgi:hypothetical protein